MLHDQITTGTTPTDTTHRRYMTYTPIWLENRTTSLATPLPDLLQALQPIYLSRIHDPLLESQDIIALQEPTNAPGLLDCWVTNTPQIGATHSPRLCFLFGFTHSLSSCT